MNTNINLVAIGRSRYLYDGIRHLTAQGYTFKAIITEEAYEEYDIKHGDFESLAKNIGASFFMTKTVNKEDIIKIIKDHNVRAAISANWKYTIPKNFLDLFECGILNFHLGNLPDYKGNATVNWSIINGENHINGNIHKMDPELDAGDIISRKTIPVDKETYIAQVLKQAEMDAPLLYEEAIKKVLANPGAYELKGSIHGLRCYPRLPEDNQINWTESVENISRLIRASSHPYRGAFSFLNGAKIIIWKAEVFIPTEKYAAVNGHIVSIHKDRGSVMVACRDGFLELQELEYDGKVMPPSEYIKSIRLRFKYIPNAGA
jgi:methionyl-tRNA formyltransferase